MPEASEAFEDLLRPVILSLAIKLSAQQVKQLSFHYRMLMQWNRKMNLSAIREPEEIVRRHYGESLFLAKSLPDAVSTLVDVGSGAGFPGVPVAVYHPNLHVTLVESIAKKATFLREATRELRNVRVLNARAETLEEHFDWVAMRAVAPAPLVPRLAELTPNLALLVTHQAVAELQHNTEISWQPPQLLPWSQGRVLLIGRRAYDVPRETS
jgi:16S rRNA (guanine527-N7)-methyltransferase